MLDFNDHVQRRRQRPSLSDVVVVDAAAAAVDDW